MKQIESNILFLLGVLAIVFTQPQCNPTYSPPVRGLMGSAPARFEQGDLELDGGMAMVALGGGLRYAPSDWLLFETGASLAGGTMGYAGPRFSLWPVTKQDHDIKMLAEVEMGFGLGAGGEYCGNNPNSSEYGDDCDGPGQSTWELDDPQKAQKPSWKRFAYGGYGGLGLGIGIHDWVDLFMKARIQETKAEGIPPTLWASFGVGIQVNIYKALKLYLYPIQKHRYWNRLDGESSISSEMGIGFNFNLLQSPRLPM